MQSPIKVKSPSLQFNKYKYAELSEKLLPLLYGLSTHQQQIGLDALYEWSWTWNIDELSNFWQQQYRQPKISPKCLTLLHYNIRSFYANQVELIEMINVYAPTIISLNEHGTNIPENVIKQTLFSYKVYGREDTNAHGGVVLAMDKN